MADNPYRMTEAELRQSTGHAPGQELIETEPELEVPHQLPMRVTPMSPATEIQAFGQLTASRGRSRRAARIAAVGLLAFLLTSVAYASHRASSADKQGSVARLCELSRLPHASAADWDAIGRAGTSAIRSMGAFENTRGNRAVFDAGATLTSLAPTRAVTLRAPSSLQPLVEQDPAFDAETSRDALVEACAR